METTIHRIPEAHVEGRRLGRHIQHDPRSRDFPAETAKKIVSVTHQAVGLPLDQGAIGSCTAQALCAALNSAPDHTAGNRTLTEDDAHALYHAETVLEGQPWPPDDPGGTGLMVCKAAKQEGLVTSYHHAFGLDHALGALVLRPVIFGVNWYASFDSVDPATGVVEIARNSQIRGGHEICADGIDADKRLVWFWQSWGAWGLHDSGRFAMSFDTVGRLLTERGDCTVPIR